MKYGTFVVDEKAYAHIDQYVDNFQRVADIGSTQMWGDDAAVDSPWITVLIPTYKRDRLFREALDSVLVQSEVDFPWEILVVDNTDLDSEGTTPALRYIRQVNNRRIRYFHHDQNLGSGYSWNRGVELARGEWVSLLHDDDVLCSDALKNIGRLLRKHAYLSCPLGYLRAIRYDFSGTFEEAQARKKGLPFCIELTRLNALISGHTGTGMPTCGTTIRKTAYMEAGGINYDFGPTADAVIGYQIMKKYTVLSSDRVLGGYRWGDNETLKLDTMRKLIQADHLFACYRYGLNAISRRFGKVFGRAQVEHNIGQKRQSAARSGLAVTREELALPGISRPYKVEMLCYQILRTIYRIILVVYSMMRYF